MKWVDMNTNTSQDDRTQTRSQDMVPVGSEAAVIEAWFARSRPCGHRRGSLPDRLLRFVPTGASGRSLILSPGGAE